MIVKTVNADAFKRIDEFLEIARDQRRRQDHACRGAEIEWLHCCAFAYSGMIGQEILEYLDNPRPQRLYRNKFPDVHRTEALGQFIFVASEECPVGEVVRVTLLNEMMLLESAEGMLKDGVFGAVLDPLEQFNEARRALRLNPKQMLGRTEVERRPSPSDGCWCNLHHGREPRSEVRACSLRIYWIVDCVHTVPTVVRLNERVPRPTSI